MLMERFVVDGTGARVGVLLDIDEYRKLMDALEELESIKAYDEVKASGDEVVCFEAAVKDKSSLSRHSIERQLING